jgi:lipopolysaccharide/colanic/teichoic acid biosynthesis glycosyltransferase
VDNLGAIIKRQKVRDVIFSTDQIEYDKIMEVMYQGRGLGINYRLVPDNLEVIIGKSSIDPLGELHLIEIDNKIDRPVSIVMKRGFDIITAAILIIFFAPLLLFWAVFKRKQFQKITARGENGKPACILIFQNEKSNRLRYIPSLISILSGDISFVGTEIVRLEDLPPKSRKIFALKPGLTGLVQISRKKNLTETEKQRHYLYYIKNYSLVLDIEILLKALLNL